MYGKGLKTPDFGRALKLYRSSKGLTQAEMAERIDVSPRYYQSLEKGEKEPSLTTIQKALSGLGLSYEEMFGTSSPEPEGRKSPPDLGQLFSLISTLKNLKGRRAQLVWMLIYDDPGYLADSPRLARSAVALLKEE
jgi:transcriptional regulator with XRE-family HTH domain